VVVDALVAALAAQGHGGSAQGKVGQLAAYPVTGNIDLLALAEAIENALVARSDGADGKSPAELNAANDG
jgi:hypothetical protein